jgi:hypothetical protein
MSQCLVCNIMEADKSGSHVIPHFILESMQNEPGVNGRDKGITFKLGETSSDLRFGRALSPEKFESLLGRAPSETEIENSVREQYHVEDHIFCTSCETKLSYLESLYKSEVDKSIQEGRKLTADQFKIAQFFWLMVILRCSVVPNTDFSLEKGLENKVKAITNRILSNSLQETKSNCLNTNLPFSLRILVNTTTFNKTRNSILLHPNYANPYLLFINEYILLFNLQSESDITSLGKILKLNLKEDYGREEIKTLDADEWENVIEYCAGTKGKQFYAANVERFRKTYYSKYSMLPQDELTKAYMDEMVYDDTIEEHTKYSESRIQSLLKKYVE